MKRCTHIEYLKMKKQTEAFLRLLHNTFLIIFVLLNTTTIRQNFRFCRIKKIRMFKEISLCTFLEYYSIRMHSNFHSIPVTVVVTELYIYRSVVVVYCLLLTHQTWGESTFNDSESDSGRLFDSESDSSQFGYDSESNSDSSNISISDSESESDSNFQLLI